MTIGWNSRCATAMPLVTGLVIAASMLLVPGSAVAEPGPTLREAKATVASLQHEAEEAGEAANDLTGQITAGRRRVAALSAGVRKQDAQVNTIRKQVGSLALATYQQAGMTNTARLLLATDPEQFLRQASTAQAYATQQAAILRRYQSATAKLADMRAGEQAELRTLNSVRSQQDQLKAKIATKLAAAEKVLARLTDVERARLAAEDAAELRREKAEAEAERRRAGRDERTGEDKDVLKNIPLSKRAKAAVAYALDQIGDPYLWAAAGPDSFDCSGLTMAAWARAGVSLSHSSKAQYNEGRRVSREALQPGDLLFYYSPISHVSMYIGNGKAVHASRPGKPVQIDPAFGQMPYVGAVRPG